jgi:hypothetical protein
MPYLNWKDREPTGLHIELAPPSSEGAAHVTTRSRMVLRFAREALAELASSLGQIFGEAGEGGELRLDLPREWIVFWKLREGDSRLLVAHPQPDEWVATVALSAADGAAFLSRISELGSARADVTEVNLGEFVRTGAVSNLELVLMRG